MPGPSTPRATDTIAHLGERALIDRIRARAGAPPSFVTIGIGDDAAVLEPERGRLDVVTTDAFVEDVHFRRIWTDAGAIGAKAVTRNLSDLAAMGATPRAILLSLILPPDLPLADFDALVEGAIAEARSAGAALVGGNISSSPGPLAIDVTALGWVGRRRALTRAGGRAGDELYLTGTVGGATAGLAILRQGQDRAGLDADAAACLRRYERPEARVRCGKMVAASRSASACMDLSDGLADAVRHIAEASGTGAVLTAQAVPVTTGALPWLVAGKGDPIRAAIGGGDDYELLFAVPPRRRRAFLGAMRLCRPLGVTLVGRLTADRAVILDGADGPVTLNSGFRHFQA